MSSLLTDSLQHNTCLSNACQLSPQLCVLEGYGYLVLLVTDDLTLLNDKSDVKTLVH